MFLWFKKLHKNLHFNSLSSEVFLLVLVSVLNLLVRLKKSTENLFFDEVAIWQVIKYDFVSIALGKYFEVGDMPLYYNEKG